MLVPHCSDFFGIETLALSQRSQNQLTSTSMWNPLIRESCSHRAGFLRSTFCSKDLSVGKGPLVTKLTWRGLEEDLYTSGNLFLLLGGVAMLMNAWENQVNVPYQPCNDPPMWPTMRKVRYMRFTIPIEKQLASQLPSHRQKISPTRADLAPGELMQFHNLYVTRAPEN